MALIGLFAIVGGSIRGFNLMLMFAGGVVGGMWVSWRMALRAIESSSTARRLPGEAFAGRPFRIRYLVENRMRLRPVWLIRIDDSVSADDNGGRGSNRTSLIRAAIGSVPPGQTRATYADAVIAHRGRYVFGPMTASTRFPLAWIDVSRGYRPIEPLLVFPRLFKMRPRWRRRLSHRGDGLSQSAARRGSSEGDFYGIRDWSPGDSPRMIHWRTTARTDQLAVRQHEQPRRLEICIVLDAFGPDDASTHDRFAAEPGHPRTSTDDDIERRFREDFESAVSLAATMLTELSVAVGGRVMLAAASSRGQVVRDHGGRSGAVRLIRPLADIQSTYTPVLADVLTSISGSHRLSASTNSGETNSGETRSGGGGDADSRLGSDGSMTKSMRGHIDMDIVVVSPRSRTAATLADPSIAAALATHQRRDRLRWIDVSTELSRWIVETG